VIKTEGCPRTLDRYCPGISVQSSCGRRNIALRQLQRGLPRLGGDQETLRNLTALPWIASLNLKANWNKASPRQPDCPGPLSVSPSAELRLIAG
jgi:hypothetical protein